MEETVLVERGSSTWLITLNRPQRLNAVDAATSAAMNRALAEYEADPDARVAILTGAGERSFSTGADLAEIAAGKLAAINDAPPGGFAAVRFPRSKPLIAAVNGLALGGGFELALSCDIVVAAEGAEFALPELSRGFVPGGGGLQRLPHVIGTQRALELILTGRRVGAAEGRELGFVNAVVPAAQLLPRAREYAAAIEANAPLAVREALAVARLAAAEGEREAWQRTAAAWQAVLASEDYGEGLAAFAERRPPRWQGR